MTGHDFPGRRSAIRIGTSPARTTDTEGCIGGGAFAALLQDDTVVTRRVEWPYDYAKDDTGPLEWLGEAYDLMRYIRGNVGRPAF